MVIALHAVVAGRAVDGPDRSVDVALPAVFLLVQQVALGYQVLVLLLSRPRGQREQVGIDLAAMDQLGEDAGVGAQDEQHGDEDGYLQESQQDGQAQEASAAELYT